VDAWLSHDIRIASVGEMIDASPKSAACFFHVSLVPLIL
jgi:hypothetical protein